MPINLTLDIVPLGDFPILDDNYIKGGFQIVADTTARDAINEASRKEGMLVWTQATSVLYQLGPGITNGDWAVFSAGGGGVTGPGSSTSKAIARWGDTSGTSLENSVVTIESDGVVTSSTTLTIKTASSDPALHINIEAGHASVTGHGSHVAITAGNGVGASYGGYVGLYSGASGIDGFSGNIELIVPDSDSSGGYGGAIYLQAGSTYGTGQNYSAGSIELSAGEANESGDGGSVGLIAGSGGIGTYAGGNIHLAVGGAGTTGPQGVIKLAVPSQGTAPELRFYEDYASGTNYFGIKAAGSMASDTTYTWPAAYPASNGYVLSSTTAGALSWTSSGGGGTSTVQDEGSTTSTTVTTFNFTGAGVTASGSGATATINIPGGGVTGPGSSTNTAIVTWNGTGGTAIANTAVTLTSQTIQASSGDLIVGGAAASTATKGVTTVRRIPATLTTSGQTLVNGAIYRVDMTVGNMEFILPNPNVSAGQSIQLILIVNGGNLAFSTPAGNVNGIAGGFTEGGGYTTSSSEYSLFTCICDGTNWWVSESKQPTGT